ncbi:MAG: cytochrome C, partial [Deltaproteobacteria bacterium]|nr:cytochrome C [Deltaproteobacteria bacterium]
MPETAKQPSVIMAGEKGCGGCHKIGRDEGRCDSCHTRHRFSAEEARRPEACATCHMGFDHPQWEMYSTSKHGAIYAIEKDKWDFSKKIEDWYEKPYEASFKTPRAPVCVTCHMEKGDHAVKTAWGFLAVRLPEEDPQWKGYREKILKGLGVLDEKGLTDRATAVSTLDMVRLSKETWVEAREKMVKTCRGCHSEAFAREDLKKSDEVIKEADRLMAEAVGIVEGLNRDGILVKSKAMPSGVDMLRFYEAEASIEQRLYVMFLEHRMRAFQGAFHANPDYMHWYGWAEMKTDLTEIREEAKRLRKEAH